MFPNTAVILAGGLGTRLSEETQTRPKPMVEIGGKPILWHILKLYSHHGINNFIICCGYKGYLIKEYFANYFLHTSDVTLHLDEDNRIEVHNRMSEPWKVTLVDTGDATETGGRLLRVAQFIREDNFCFTYGDGLSNVDIHSLVNQHQQYNPLVTLTAVKPPGRYGALNLNRVKVRQFEEKPPGDNAFVNGGFFAVNKKIFEYIPGDTTSWENDVLPRLAANNQLNAYIHHGFWQPMDTLRDRFYLEQLWCSGNAPWHVW